MQLKHLTDVFDCCHLLEMDFNSLLSNRTISPWMRR